MKTIIDCVDLSWLWSPKDYWYAIVSALVGAAIGIWWANGQFKKQMARMRSNCLVRLNACIEFNLERLRQAKGQLAESTVPNYPFDTAQLNHWLAQSHDSLPPELLRNLDWQRFQLDHISTKFVVVNNAIVSTAGEKITAEQVEHRRALIKSLAVHVDTVLRELPPLLNQLPKS